jgi:gamma-glutamylcyclotransferase (GGCT)/AIG2-like uncharacterized protein YtfP
MELMMPDALPPFEAPTRHVFVYGTLRRGGCNDIRRYPPAPVFVGFATVAGTLFDLGAYPGARLGGQGTLRGEVYRVSAEVEAAMDVLEGAAPDGSGEYEKCELRVLVDDVLIDCLVYQIHSSRITGRQVIRSGDWMDR